VQRSTDVFYHPLHSHNTQCPLASLYLTNTPTNNIPYHIHGGSDFYPLHYLQHATARLLISTTHCTTVPNSQSLLNYMMFTSAEEGGEIILQLNYCFLLTVGLLMVSYCPRLANMAKEPFLPVTTTSYCPPLPPPPHSMHRYSTNAKLISPSQYLVPILHMPT